MDTQVLFKWDEKPENAITDKISHIITNQELRTIKKKVTASKISDCSQYIFNQNCWFSNFS